MLEWRFRGTFGSLFWPQFQIHFVGCQAATSSTLLSPLFSLTVFSNFCMHPNHQVCLLNNAEEEAQAQRRPQSKCRVKAQASVFETASLCWIKPLIQAKISWMF